MTADRATRLAHLAFLVDDWELALTMLATANRLRLEELAARLRAP